jgi:hypothetical protein
MRLSLLEGTQESTCESAAVPDILENPLESLGKPLKCIKIYKCIPFWAYERSLLGASEIRVIGTTFSSSPQIWPRHPAFFQK